MPALRLRPRVPRPTSQPRLLHLLVGHQKHRLHLLLRYLSKPQRTLWHRRHRRHLWHRRHQWHQWHRRHQWHQPLRHPRLMLLLLLRLLLLRLLLLRLLLLRLLLPRPDHFC